MNYYIQNNNLNNIKNNLILIFQLNNHVNKIIKKEKIKSRLIKKILLEIKTRIIHVVKTINVIFFDFILFQLICCSYNLFYFI